jgi:AraC-like DNA-binding protein
MSIESVYLGLLLISLSVMLVQLFIRKKRLEHIFLAIFSGSLAMVAIKFLGAEELGPYQYLVGLFTCATCNLIWLISRSMFRGESSIKLRHIAFAFAIALVTVFSQGIQFAASFSWLGNHTVTYLQGPIDVIGELLSSTVLLLTFWEAIRSDGIGKVYLRYIFAFTYAFGILICTVGMSLLVKPEQVAEVFPWVAGLSGTLILVVTQIVQYLQYTDRQTTSKQFEAGIQHKTEHAKCAKNTSLSKLDLELSSGIEHLLEKEKIFLQHNLKMIDIARALKVSEYKVSKVIRYHFNAPNFNHFINRYRLGYAKALLEDANNTDWSILVIGMESGFSSVTSFNRAFKAYLQCSPNEYRMGGHGSQQKFCATKQINV